MKFIEKEASFFQLIHKIWNHIIINHDDQYSTVMYACFNSDTVIRRGKLLAIGYVWLFTVP